MNSFSKNITSVLYVPYMSDHAIMIAAAFKACGVNAIALPESDFESLEAGRDYLTGKECLPMAITLGDFLKVLNKKTFEDEVFFFMPTADGPCRFGQYAPLQEQIFSDIGFKSVKIVSLNSTEIYSNLTDFSSSVFKKNSWKGVVAVDVLQKLLWSKRPYEANAGETDFIYSKALKDIERSIERKGENFNSILKKNINFFDGILIKADHKRPVIGVVGEIFCRGNRLANCDLVKKIEEFGGEALVAPMSEWPLYTTYLYKQKSLKEKKIRNYLRGLVDNSYKNFIERKATGMLRHNRKDKEPSIENLVAEGNKYISSSLDGEAVLSIGKAVHMIRNRGVSGIINIMPFSCMPGLIVTALSGKIRRDHDNFPWLNIDYDGNRGGNVETRLEAFIHQIRK